MTKTELYNFLHDTKDNAEEVINKMQAKINEEKAKMDTETRRKLRCFYIPCCIICLLLGYYACLWTH